MSSMPTLPIAILGAGPSGLILGRLLEKQNIKYTVFERDVDGSVVNQGGSLDIHRGSGQLALEEAGLIEEFRNHARLDCVTTLADKQGNVAMSLQQESDRPEIDRKALRQLLLESIPEDRVQWNSKVARVVKEEDGKMAVHLTNGSVHSGFKLVVGADGAWSKARSLVTAAKPEYSGKCYLTTHIHPGNPQYSAIKSLARNGSYMALAEQKFLFAQYVGDGSIAIGFGLYLPEEWSEENRLLGDHDAMKRWILDNQMAGWPEMHVNFIKYAEPGWRRWPLYALPTEALSWETVSGVALVGDAAHVTTPFKGEGVNCAMHDSVELAQNIAKYGLDKLDQAVSEYEKVMLPRGIDLITKSAESGDFLFAPDAPYGWLKNVAGKGDQQHTTVSAQSSLYNRP